MQPREKELINRLIAGAEAGTMACGGYLASLDPLHRTELCSKLLFERLERKMQLVSGLYREAAENWNQTFYLLYFRTLGDRQNQEAYLDLARRVPYRYLLRERLTPHAIETMLIGTSGLLSLYPKDSYTERLTDEYRHLAAKYNLQPMESNAWVLHEVRPANHPILRLAQAAEFFQQDEFLMDRVLECRDERSVQRLFCIETNNYWRTHYTPANQADDHPKRLGRFKAHVLGINLVAMLQFAYGSLTGREELRDRALMLLEKLPAEENRYMRLWQREGVRLRDAFESQALLQLITEYCLVQRCEACPVARRMVRELAR